MLASINTPSVWGKCHKKETSRVLPCVIFLASLQYYFSCTLCRALLSKSMSLSQCSAVETYYFMSSVTAKNKFLAGTFFCPAIIKYHIPI